MTAKDDKHEGATVEELLREIRIAKEAQDKIADRIKTDLNSSLGVDSLWSSGDLDSFGQDRAHISVPIIGPLIDRLLGLYDQNPYGIVVSPYNLANAQRAQLVQAVVRGIENRSSARQAYRTALRSAMACGYGYLHAFTSPRPDASNGTEIELEALPSPMAVLVDPLAVKEDASDARFIAYAERISRDEAIEKYGDVADVEGSTGELALLLLGTDSYRESVAVATIYRLEEGTCVRYVVVGSSIVSRIDMQISRLPIVRCVGVAAWSSEKESWTFTGIGHRAEGVQRLTQFAASQMCERLALSPKAGYLVDMRSIEPYKQQWATSNRLNHPYLPYDSVTDDQEPCQPPIKQEVAVNTADSQAVISLGIELLETTTGVSRDMLGTGGNLQMTATEALTRSRSAEAIVSGVFESLGGAVRQVGRVLLELIVAYWQAPQEVQVAMPGGQAQRGQFGAGEEGIVPTDYEIDIDAGPMLASQRRETAQQLTALIQVAPALAPQIIPALLKNIDGEGMVELARRLEQTGAQADAQVQQAQAQVQALTMQIEQGKLVQDQMRNQIVALQNKLSERAGDQQIRLLEMQNENAQMVEKFRQDLALANLKEQSLSQREARDLASREAMEAARLQQETQNDADKLMLEAEKLKTT